ncbi:MAG TPA: LuxR C-terminal-related transcriptional regulator [Candidatus Obscuribacterales bacterium]
MNSKAQMSNIFSHLPVAANPERSPATSLDQQIVGLDLALLNAVLNSLGQGFIVVSPNLQLIYWNQQAVELCRWFPPTGSALPEELETFCRLFLRRNCPESQVVLADYQIEPRMRLQVSARWLKSILNSGETTAAASRGQGILLVLQDRQAILAEELQLVQTQLDLTKREAEIWLLLKQEYTYQEIAQTLQVSLNTVKTHIKNLYSKKRIYQC